MKRFLLSLISVVLLLSLIACETPGSTDDTSDSTDTESPDVVSSVYGETKTLNIHKISELNTTEYSPDSAAGEEELASIVKNYRESYTLTHADLGGVHAYYPRLKKINEENYLLFYHDEVYGGSVYCSRSSDCMEWSSPIKVFKQSTVVVDGKEDNLKYMTGDACVLDDGCIIAVTAFRAEFSYYTHEGENGVAVSFSSDNGKTWTEPEVVYVGTVWEPSVMQDDNGEIYIFFTCSAPSTYLYGFDNLSSGIGFVRSKDNGKTFTPKITEAPYIPQYVMRQYMGTSPAGIKIFNDQMPAPLKLNNGTIVLAAETHNSLTNALKFSIAYVNDGFDYDLGMNESGPKDKQVNLFNLAGPYLMQFDSGEVLLTYNWSGKFKYRLADCSAEKFYDEKIILEESGSWGSSEKLSSHSAALLIGTDDYYLSVTRVYLNHTLNAKKLTSSMTANTEEWNASTDAIFLGAESQAQVSTRLAYDDDYVYLLSERIDRYIMDGDELSVAFYGVNGDHYIVNMSNSGYNVTTRNKENKKESPIDHEALGIKAYAAIDGTPDSILDMDNGIVYEVAIPRELVENNGDIFYRVRMTNEDAKDTHKEDSNPNASIMSSENWAKAVID